MTSPVHTPDARALDGLDVLACPLDGINLIEASAGTGKTWNICALYLRLLLETGLEVQQILVVTFTNAAVAELRDRVRQRLIGMLACLEAETEEQGDLFLQSLRERLVNVLGYDLAALRAAVSNALASFDEAAIFTIHGYCQRALADAPFSAKMPLAMELLHDDSPLLHEAVNDFWRRRVAGVALDPPLATYLLARKDSPVRFAKLVRRHLGRPDTHVMWPRAVEDCTPVDLDGLSKAYDQARSLWIANRAAILGLVKDALSDLSKTSYNDKSLADAAACWDRWCEPGEPLAGSLQEPGKAALLGRTRLDNGRLAGAKKLGKRLDHPFFEAAQTLLDLADVARSVTAMARIRLLRDLIEETMPALREIKRARRVLSFDDMLVNLHARLKSDVGGEHHDGDEPGKQLASTLAARFPAALIDEFQDTDPVQFGIFRAIYGAGDKRFFMVGDPKQAIYSFRNADLHTYLRAREESTNRYTIADNQRASRGLIDALNLLFRKNPNAFMLEGLAFPEVGFGAKPRSELVDKSSSAAAPLHIWMLPDGGASGGLRRIQVAKQEVAQACAGEISRLLAAGQCGEITIADEPLHARDIAILVRSHADGRLMRQALAKLRIGSVELSQESIFQSIEAEELERLLAAILEPTRERVVKAALATEFMGVSALAIEALAGDEARFLACVQTFAGWREVWLRRGPGLMLRQWFVDAGVAERVLGLADGERRLTNLLHLIECVHQAGIDHHSPEALLQWLQRCRIEPDADEASQLRLESDQNLVRIITVHKAKGLEFPVVFCPFLFNGRRNAPNNDGIDGVDYHDDDGHPVIDYRKGLDAGFDDKEIGARIRLESAAEQLRLIYVALTRAVHRCVLVAGVYATGSKGVSTSESARSLLNWLVAGEGHTPADWLDSTKKNLADVADITAAWTDIAQALPIQVSASALSGGAGQVFAATTDAGQLFEALPPPREISRAWWLGSYSALAYDARHERAVADHDLRAVPVTRSTATDTHPAREDILNFPRGPGAGDCLHEVFQNIAFADRSAWPAAIKPALRKLQYAGAADLADEALNTRRVLAMLADVLDTALPVGTASPLSLATVIPEKMITELEFHMPVAALTAGALNQALVHAGYANPGLGFSKLQGYLKGFIDLVCEHEGRYYVLDWKSNHLGNRSQDYAQAALSQAMNQHNYPLQALIYCVALDRFLRTRLHDYDPQQHFGGAIYLFVRGVRPGWQDEAGLATGFHFDRPDPAVIESLSVLLDAHR